MIVEGEGNQKELNQLIKLLEEKNTYLQEREHELADKTEELVAQKEMLTAAIEEMMSKNNSLNEVMITLRDRNFELDQILYRTSHDLRSPLSSIRGILGLLKMEPQSPTIKEYQEHIESKVNQMDNLLRSLSSLSKAILEKPSYSNVSLESVIHQVSQELKYLPSWSRVSIANNLQVADFKTDSFLMTIIIQSLLSNAYIFRDPGKPGMISINSSARNADVMIDVIDDGDGIPSSVLDHIFKMFYRGSEKSTGSGLGLYVAQKAIEQLKGSIAASTTDGNTKFTVILPLLP